MSILMCESNSKTHTFLVHILKSFPDKFIFTYMSLSGSDNRHLYSQISLFPNDLFGIRNHPRFIKASYRDKIIWVAWVCQISHFLTWTLAVYLYCVGVYGSVSRKAFSLRALLCVPTTTHSTNYFSLGSM